MNEDDALAAKEEDRAIGMRLAEAIRSVAPGAAAKVAGCSVNTLRRWMTGQVSADAKGLARIAAWRGVSLDWLIAGEEPDPPLAVLKKVPIVDVTASGGPGGGLAASDTVLGYLSFPEDMLRRLGNPDELELVTIRGDSMAPELKDGDLAMINRANTNAEGLGIFQMDDLLLAKRLRLLGGGKAELVSTNPSYPPILVDLKAQAMRNLGRIVWTGKAL